jgi:hypothetical protein
MSRREARATVDSINRAVDHNLAMSEYAQGYVDRLTASRHSYENTETHNTSNVQHSDGA